MKRILVTKVLPDGYGVGVIPEMEKPLMSYYYGEEDKYMAALKRFSDNVKVLPTFLVHPSLNPKEGGWIEQWREGFETVGFHGDWHECSKSRYDSGIDDCRRIVLLPLVEGNTPASEQVIRSKEEILKYYLKPDWFRDGESGKAVLMAMGAYHEQFLLNNKSQIINGIKDGCDEIIDLIDEYFPVNEFKEHLRDCVHCLRDTALAASQSPPSLQEREKEGESLHNNYTEREKALIRGALMSGFQYGHGKKYPESFIDRIANGELLKIYQMWEVYPSPPNESQDTAKQSK